MVLILGNKKNANSPYYRPVGLVWILGEMLAQSNKWSMNSKKRRPQATNMDSLENKEGKTNS